MASRYFYDLPVYRLPRNEYYDQRDAFIESNVFQIGKPIEAALRERERLSPHINAGIRNHLERSFGGCWDFNEIIGHIRLHFLGSQVRGEYFAVSRSRIVRTRTKIFEYQTWKLAPEVDIEPPCGSKEVLVAARQYIEDCRREVPLRFVDATMFEVIAPHMDWASLLRAVPK
jgi:hypothetical protein